MSSKEELKRIILSTHRAHAFLNADLERLKGEMEDTTETYDTLEGWWGSPGMNVGIRRGSSVFTFRSGEASKEDVTRFAREAVESAKKRVAACRARIKAVTEENDQASNELERME